MTTSVLLHSMENLEKLWVHRILHRECDNELLKWFWLLDLHQTWQGCSSEPLNQKCGCARAWVVASLACNWSNRSDPPHRESPSLTIELPLETYRNLDCILACLSPFWPLVFIHDAFFCRYCYCSTKEVLKKALSHHQWRNEASPYSHQRDWLRPFFLDIHWGTAPNKAAGHNKSSPRGTSAVKHSRR